MRYWWWGGGVGFPDGRIWCRHIMRVVCVLATSISNIHTCYRIPQRTPKTLYAPKRTMTYDSNSFLRLAKSVAVRVVLVLHVYECVCLCAEFHAPLFEATNTHSIIYQIRHGVCAMCVTVYLCAYLVDASPIQSGYWIP